MDRYLATYMAASIPELQFVHNQSDLEDPNSIEVHSSMFFQVTTFKPTIKYFYRLSAPSSILASIISETRMSTSMPLAGYYQAPSDAAGRGNRKIRGSIGGNRREDWNMSCKGRRGRGPKLLGSDSFWRRLFQTPPTRLWTICWGRCSHNEGIEKGSRSEAGRWTLST